MPARSVPLATLADLVVSLGRRLASARPGRKQKGRRPKTTEGKNRLARYSMLAGVSAFFAPAAAR